VTDSLDNEWVTFSLNKDNFLCFFLDKDQSYLRFLPPQPSGFASRARSATLLRRVMIGGRRRQLG